MIDTSPSGIRTLLAKGESASVEFKVAYKATAQLALQITSMDRYGGGIVLFGVTDRGQIVGLSDQDVQATRERIRRFVAHTLPNSQWSVNSVEIDGKTLLALQLFGVSQSSEIDEVKLAQSRHRIERSRQFVTQSILLLIAFSGFWFLVDRSNSYGLHVFRSLLPHFSITNAFSLEISLLALWALLFYGSSYELLPLSFVPNFHLSRYGLLTRQPDAIEERGDEETDLRVAHQRQLDNAHEVETPIASSIVDVNLPFPESDSKALQAAANTAGLLIDEVSGRAAYFTTKLEKRTNTYMALGVSIGFVGLVVWAWRFSIPLQSGNVKDFAQALFMRVTVLLFIELLAGFFLRQYRIGIEDFKYFFEVEQKARWKLVAFSILSQKECSPELADFAKTLGEGTFGSTLRTGESTPVLEAMKSEQNVALEAVKMMTEATSKLASKASTK